MKEEFKQVTFTKGGDVIRAYQTGLDSSGFHFFVVDATAVVFYFNKDVVAAMVRADGNIAVIALSGVIALILTFKSVRH